MLSSCRRPRPFRHPLFTPVRGLQLRTHLQRRHSGHGVSRSRRRPRRHQVADAATEGFVVRSAADDLPLPRRWLREPRSRLPAAPRGSRTVPRGPSATTNRRRWHRLANQHTIPKSWVPSSSTQNQMHSVAQWVWRQGASPWRSSKPWCAYRRRSQMAVSGPSSSRSPTPNRRRKSLPPTALCFQVSMPFTARGSVSPKRSSTASFASQGR